MPQLSSTVAVADKIRQDDFMPVIYFKIQAPVQRIIETFLLIRLCFYRRAAVDSVQKVTSSESRLMGIRFFAILCPHSAAPECRLPGSLNYADNKTLAGLRPAGVFLCGFGLLAGCAGTTFKVLQYLIPQPSDVAPAYFDRCRELTGPHQPVDCRSGQRDDFLNLVTGKQFVLHGVFSYKL